MSADTKPQLRQIFRTMDPHRAQEIREAYYKAVEGLRTLTDELERAENAENEETSAKQVNDDGVFVSIPLRAEWVPEEWMNRNKGRRHITIVADGIIQDEAKPNVVNRVQRGILHDCRLESYEKMSRDGIEYWNAKFFVPCNPVYSIGASRVSTECR